MSLTHRLARPLLASIFIADGLDALRRPDSHVERFRKAEPLLEKVGLGGMAADPRLLVRATGAVTTVSAIMLATSRKPRTAALTLAAITVPLTLVNNPVWSAHDRGRKRELRRGLLRGASATGGLLLAALDRDGKPSLGWRLTNNREHRAAMRELKGSLTS
ncbi:DoxX family protein [Georgenia faecalis]|uniref:DoxX family protein n=1 Tax=Georgenia faecalis TaxID=2483799 RepID=A0ABV9DCY3_9MICO|nr:DoxX family membrane protein [Georgenia faecalis]